MDEIKVGEYVRLENGLMGKISEVHIDYYDVDIIFGQVFETDIRSHSKNIIGLIEVGDFVNGCLIVEISKDPFIKGQINLWTNMILSEGEPFPNEYYKAKILENEIKTILTHEMYEQNCYKVGEINE